ncbi:MAG: GNAT family N-acetyltransferase [Rickettsiaceae bacterium]|nr:GNAT family N-acetyltransferase [Rickettsiaceae bacterium]
MSNNIIIYQKEINTDCQKIILEGLKHNAYEKLGIGQSDSAFSFVIENDQDEFQAGISGYHYYGCFYIDILFVPKEHRSKGYGTELMQKAEELARSRDCLFMAVNTMEFEARPFYEKHGFEVEFVRSGFQKNAKMYFMRKKLQ